MKKTLSLLCLIIALSSLSISAQTLRWGVEAGLTFNRATEKGTSRGWAPGFTVAGRVEAALTRQNPVWFVTGGIGVNIRRWYPARDLDYLTITTPEKTVFVDYCDPTFIEIPIGIAYRRDISRKIGLHAEFGPWFGVGVGGKMSVMSGGNPASSLTASRASGSPQYGVDDIAAPGQYKNGCFDRVYRRFETGLRARIGATFFNHFELNVEYSHQLNTIGKHLPYRQQTIGIALGYIF